MNNIIDLKPNIIIGNTYEGVLKMDSWRDFQSRQGFYGSLDKDKNTEGFVKVFVQGKEVDYVKTTTIQQVNSIRFLIENSDRVTNSLLVGLLEKLPELKDIYDDLIPEIQKTEDFKKVFGREHTRYGLGQGRFCLYWF